MAAPRNNQFWKARSKHGRDRIFASADILWEAACEYFDWCDKTPIDAIDYKGKDAKRVKVPKMRAYTIHGLCLFLGVNTLYFSQFEKSLDKEKDQDFSFIITRIKEIIYTQKFTGAAADLLNANIISRELGIQDKLEVKGTIVQSEPLTKEEIEQLKSHFDSEY